jgi:hypothetical protein
MRAPVFFVGLLLLTATGCPGGNHEKSGSALPPCRKFGDNCEFSPGKLGSCVMRDGCTAGGSACFVCQSQH